MRNRFPRANNPDCPKTEKRRFATQQAAEMEAAHLTFKLRQEFFVYPCPCTWWHLTTLRPRPAPTPTAPQNPVPHPCESAQPVTTTRPRLDDANCRGREDLYLKPARGSRITEMRAICGNCWDRSDCLTWALEHEEHGYWAGHSAKERAALRTTYGIELKTTTTRGDNHGRTENAVAAAH